MNKTIFLISILLISVFISAIEAKEQVDFFTGIYEMNSNKNDNRDGSLTVRKLSPDKISFTLYCALGEPTYNQGDAEGIAFIKKNHAIYKDRDCKISFTFKGNKVIVEEDNPAACMGYGNRVYCSGIYKLKTNK